MARKDKKQQEKGQAGGSKASYPWLACYKDMGVPADWRKAPQSGAPTVISLFSGCGGSSLGYRLAGFRELLAVDFDAHACECFRLNFPDVACWQRDVCDVTADEIMDFCGLERGGLDVLDGSPPCQGFSTAGKRRVIDSRNDLFREYVRLVDGLHPKVFVMENVTGMVKGKMKGRFIEIMRALKGLPYRVECRKLNAMWYGVPQSRERIFVMGVRTDAKALPSWPGHMVDSPITTGEAFMGLFNEDNEVADTGETSETGRYSARRFGDHILNENNSANTVTRIRRQFVVKSERHTDDVIDAWEKAKPGQSLREAKKYVGSYQSRRLDPGRPSYVLVKAHRHWSYREPRQLTDMETKRICSFPDDYRLVGSKMDRNGMLGNSVMPLQMMAIAETIKREIL